MIRSLRFAAAPLLCSIVLSGCEAKKSENPLSPAVAGPIAGVEITAPVLVEPAQGFKVKESHQPLKLVIQNSTTNGVRPLTFSFDVATDAEFQAKVYARGGVPPGEGGTTTVTVDRLELGRAYFWRVRAEDGANSSAYSTASFEVLPKPMLTAPKALSPVSGETTGNRRPELKTVNSDHNEAVGFLRYEFQIAGDVGFGGIAAAGTRDEGSGTTEFVPDGDLATSTTYYWRVRSSDGETTSAWSGIESFRTPSAPAPAPTPPPAPQPGGGPCNFGDPQSIVQCERSKYGFMDRGQILEFLRSVARSLNRNGIAGGPWGILRKESGNNCGGYSCDIICTGQGTGQLQYDVLGDVDVAQTPGWGAPHRYPDIRIDVCEIQ